MKTKSSYNFSEPVKWSLYKIFDMKHKQNTEISTVHDILPVIKDKFLITQMTPEILYIMDDIMKSVMKMLCDNGIVFYATPVFTCKPFSTQIIIHDIVYKKL